MKISCEIIKDLLPLYHDGVCSEESRMLVNEHILQCNSCKAELEQIDTELTLPKQVSEDTSALKKISVAWHKGKEKAFIKGLLIATSICAILICGYVGLTQLKVIPVKSDIIEIRNVCQLQDGRIVFHVEITDDLNLRKITFKQESSGGFYLIPLRAVITEKRMVTEGLYNMYDTLDIAEHNASEATYGSGIEVTSYYFGSEDDAILIWEKGMELPAASPEIEAMFAAQ